MLMSALRGCINFLPNNLFLNFHDVWMYKKKDTHECFWGKTQLYNLCTEEISSSCRTELFSLFSLIQVKLDQFLLSSGCSGSTLHRSLNLLPNQIALCQPLHVNFKKKKKNVLQYSFEISIPYLTVSILRNLIFTLNYTLEKILYFLVHYIITDL